MGLRSVTVERFTVREVRDGLRQSPAAPKLGKDPLWMRQIDWATVVHELGRSLVDTSLEREGVTDIDRSLQFWRLFGLN